jgi:predicted component of viral defense system (DUF524 family)
VTARILSEARWAGYRISPVGDALLREHEDDTLEIVAERQYLLEVPVGDHVTTRWQGFRSLQPGLGLLQLINFIGETRIGGRRILVTSKRLRPNEIQRMLDDVILALQSLPFSYEAPTSFSYERDALTADDVTYQAYAFIRHAIIGVGPHNLTAAVDRILTRPNRRLVQTSADIALAEADRVGAQTVSDLGSRAAPLYKVDPHSPFASTPLARALAGRVPERVRSTRGTETTDTLENAFVATVLDLARDVVDRFSSAARERGGIGAPHAISEAQGLSQRLDRWRRHPVLAPLKRVFRLSLESSVLRGRPGYREFARFFVDLQSRTRLLTAFDAERLLDARDAALIYEYWCFFQVVSALSSVLGKQPKATRFRFDSFGASLPRGSDVDFGTARVWFNREFRKRSYSVPLRPDISVELENGELHLFDAKLKRDPIVLDASASDDGDFNGIDGDEALTYRRADLYKMHTYRDALHAKSVWILFPGKNVPVKSYSPESPSETSHHPVEGVGAVPLLPGSDEGNAELETLMREILSAT